MKTYYVGSVPVSDELYHYGILGQKWGVRRYQNKDGTLTEEGKKRYGRNVSEEEAFNNFLKEDKRTQYELAKKYGTVDPKIIKKDIKTGNKDALRDDFQGVLDGLNRQDDKIVRQKELQKQRYDDRNAVNKMAEDADVGNYAKGLVTFFDDNYEQPKRYVDATNLGLNALRRLGHLSWDEGNKEWTNNDRDWFAFEDQTPGLASISDLVMRGKSKRDIMNMLDQAWNYVTKYNQHPEGPASELTFAVETNGRKELEEFIDACIEENSIKHGSDYIRSYFGILI